MGQVRTVKVRYTIDALSHVADIHAYINARNPTAATRVIARIRTAAERLGEYPDIGRMGAAPGTQEWVVTGLPYIIVYEQEKELGEVTVLGIYHGAQIRPGRP